MEITSKKYCITNTGLSIEDLNYAVQLTIDRIIFLRIAEDRGIERYGQLEKRGVSEIQSPLLNIYNLSVGCNINIGNIVSILIHPWSSHDSEIYEEVLNKLKKIKDY